MELPNDLSSISPRMSGPDVVSSIQVEREIRVVGHKTRVVQFDFFCQSAAVRLMCLQSRSESKGLMQWNLQKDSMCCLLDSCGR
jgi:hypothetical protein